MTAVIVHVREHSASWQGNHRLGRGGAGNHGSDIDLSGKTSQLKGIVRS